MRLSRVLLAALLALSHHPRSAGGRVVAVWTDIEAIMGGRGTPNATTPPTAADVARSERFIEVIANASTLAHTGGFRLAVDANAAWSGRVSTDLPLRPLHQQVMDIVDEITLMDYFEDCARWTGPTGGHADDRDTGQRDDSHLCSIDEAVFNLTPFLIYADFLANQMGHVCLVDTGLSMATQFPPGTPNVSTAGWDNTAIHTELELETFLRRGNDLTSKFLAQGLHRHFAVFEHINYLVTSAHWGCPLDHSFCGANTTRPPRALWMYDTLPPDPAHTPMRLCTAYPTGNQCGVLGDLAARARFFDWCAERNIVELYINILPSATDKAQRAAFTGFVRDCEARGIDVQLDVGEDLTDPAAIYQRIEGVAAWCKEQPALCGGWPCSKANNFCKRPAR